MASQFSMLGIFNAALVSQGQDEIALGDGSHEWRILSRNWPTIVEAELEDGNYRFTKNERFLNTRADGSYGYDDGYLIPGDVLHVRRLWIEDERGDRREPDWTQDGTHVYLNEPNGVIAECIIVSEPDLWRPNFVRGVQMKHEAVILRAIKEEYGEAAEMEDMAEIYFQRARAKSSNSGSAHTAYRKGPIATARHSRGAR